ncbi:sensor histidine kinase [Alloscardovia venturai]|uniref:histidine kinase n=2 Tax=Alloscardovia venturai TaxID=1769421 RepID=A0ABW2Y4V9_9BIFI
MLVLIFLVVASSILVGASRQLVSAALMEKTDTQLLRQANLVVNNINLLQSENNQQSNSENLSSSGSSDSLDDLGSSNFDGSAFDYLFRGALSNSNSKNAVKSRPQPLSTTGNQNLGPTDYFVQIRDNDNQILSMPVVPVAHDGVLAIPSLPQEGKSAQFAFNRPTTVEAKVQVAQGVAMNEQEAKIAHAPWRVIAMQMKSTSGDQYVAYIGLSLFDVNDTTNALTRYFIWSALAIVVAAGLLAFLAIRRALNPLKQMEKTAAKIATGDLSQRIANSLPENTEIGSLSASLNTMLARIERSFKKQEDVTNQMKRFVSDASHELRTPLAVIHGSTELYKMQRNAPGTDPAESADMVIDHIEKSSSRMTALVEDLLSLARLDEGRGIDVSQTIHVDDMLVDSVEDLHALNPERKITLGRLSLSAGSILQSVHKESAKSGAKSVNTNGDMSDDSADTLTFIPGTLPVLTAGGDPVRMRQVMTNIIGNIHRYTPSQSPVEVGASLVRARIDANDLAQLPSTRDSLTTFLSHVSSSVTASGNNDALEYVVIRIADHGPGMSEESRDRIFERFYTADTSRAREKGGTGLGMSIAQSVVKAHHGLICATSTPGGGLTFTVILPISQTVLFRSPDPVEERLRERTNGPAIFGKRRRSKADDMKTIEIDISLNSKNRAAQKK